MSSDNRAGSISKSVQKHAGRAKERILQNLGKADRTTDDILNLYISNFNKQHASAQRLSKEFKNYVSCARAMQAAKIKNKIAKRGRKLVDYDKCRHNLQALQQPSRKREEMKIGKAKERLDEAQVRATYKYTGEDVDELCFEIGDIIRVVEYDDPEEQEEGWLMGIKESTGEKGLFPANFTRPI
ncbi:Myc box-dependent-interacting protein 1 like protein [Argiope bruennichi]|uniref:Myc box-dependent-interacting protein 1 like protein n=1 Tax=Argiope bruennichi TaxID=94029 RepID=A0A8T0FLG6_ARGBR|nr:Myc box-dependent-interacting protein 1 like protein [Argiope bruennichi]